MNSLCGPDPQVETREDRYYAHLEELPTPKLAELYAQSSAVNNDWLRQHMIDELGRKFRN